jgi:hypothetical protein
MPCHQPHGERIAVQSPAVVSVNGHDRPVVFFTMDLAQQSLLSTRRRFAVMPFEGANIRAKSMAPLVSAFY